MKQPRISIIAALAENRGIGKDNRLLWHIPEDMRRFRELTTGHAVVMGQKTYESIGRPLPNRTNVVLTRDPGFAAPGCVVCRSLDEALEKARETEEEEVFIIGGGTVYRQTLPLADRLYLTLVKGEFEADTFFPDFSEFRKEADREDGRDENHEYSFVVLERGE
jgi:dihydrofolate reductase